MTNLMKSILLTAVAVPFLVAAPVPAKSAQDTTKSTVETKTVTKPKGHKKHVTKTKTTEKTQTAPASTATSQQ